MNFLYLLLISIVNNLDTIAVRLAYSLKGIKIPFLMNLWVSFIGFFFSAMAAFWGNELANFLPTETSKILSMILLVFIGIWLILEPVFARIKAEKQKKTYVLSILADPSVADRDGSNELDFKEASFLGIALSLNNIGGGITAGVLGFGWFIVGLLSALFSFAVLQCGNQLSFYLEKLHLGNKANFLAGFLLIAVGIKQLF